MLYGTYRAVEWRWPERYIGMTQTFGLSAQQTSLRFFAYRCVPTYLFAATCFVTVERLGGNAWISAGVMWTCSVAATHGRVVVEGLVRKWGEANYALFHLAMLVLLGGVVVAARLTTRTWAVLVPSPGELLAALWSGLLVAGIGGFAVFVLRPRKNSSPSYGAAYFVERASRDVGIEALDWLFAESLRVGANPILLKAILVVEALQRPRWARSVERAFVYLRLARTSGVMQMSSTRPLTDRESISEAATQYAGTWALRFQALDGLPTWTLDSGDAWEHVTAHNGDVAFAESVRDIANHLLETVSGRWTRRSENAPILLELRRFPARFAFRGVARADELTLLELNGAAHYQTISPPADRTPGSWWAWECEISPSARTVAVIDKDKQAATVASLADGQIADVQATDASDIQFLINADSSK
ncbi:hypothetical protein [Microbacterium natoriense]|nr:hypothetical protein [Microbacterium natoriense]